MNQKTVIILSGFKQSGKDTVAALIKEQFPSMAFRTIAFADPIKWAAMNILGLRDVAGWDTAKTQDIVISGQSVNGRHVVREIGMLMRSYDEKQFTEYVGRHVFADAETNWIVTDMRFDNELQWLRSVKFLYPYVNFVAINVQREGTGSDGHVSETGFPDDVFDVIIENDGTLEQLSDRVQNLWLQ